MVLLFFECCRPMDAPALLRHRSIRRTKAAFGGHGAALLRRCSGRFFGGRRGVVFRQTANNTNKRIS
ncbi:hypothetical protein N231_04830 [Geobacillus stearothermophilus ATCC 12980]|uniref:Uncharacterized protein n=2 Tax=Geobacillus stearothermophilus TaxID=1422 RepID=A0A087LA00_GEOSE|nr:hypothetical protein GLN3_01285 [Geobacillus lituanicus]KFL14453.1 hypothetical protein ET31_17500 [Geobacillus stearothermophilus]KOR94952.1 hypothetical protein N231_04830 [Geobacillus stearothermophilus ATCC 12980]OPX01658.1 hypothetical protein B1A75_15305 [Geobacillus sp. LEMMY01]PJW13997.1 hypothetical protein CV945_11035 [Geobacillus sp. Manikaran-105]PJW17660.1 hypothetical protein CV944_07750 [Geobacillus sp. WSUCF-018B]